MASETANGQVLVDREDDDTDQEWLEVGRRMATPLPGEEVVITGMSGHFPESNDVAHYRDNLLSKKSLITHDKRRWEVDNAEIPDGIGKINDIEKFDAGFFGMHYRQAQSLDPMCRQLLERSFEAMIDAGVNPSDLRGSNTGVYIGAATSETEHVWFHHKLEPNSFAFTGCQRSMLANRISYFFGLNGPSHVMETACSTSMTILEHAYRAIRMGRCDNALVGAVTLCLHPAISTQFSNLGTLSKSCLCRSFDNDANGFVRAEASVVVFLQKSKNAKRIYAQILNTKNNCDGFKEEGITFPSRFVQKRLLTETYQDCQILPETVDFVEGHVTGTKVGDPEELAAIDAVFCTNRKIPLLVGSVKSNIGHTETASGLSSLIKVLLSMEMNCILPNINYSKPRKGIEALEKGRMTVVTDTIPWPKNGSGIVGISNFGFGGTNGHIILKRFTKQKVNNGLPSDNIARLVCVSGRTEHAVNYILDDISQRKLDVESVKLFHEVFRNNIDGHPVRGYILKSKTAEICRSVKRCDEVKKSLCLVFNEPKSNWCNIFEQLLTIPLFAASIQKIHNILAPKGIHITDLMCNRNQPNKSIVNMIVGNVAIQIGLFDVLKAIGPNYECIIGYSTGELVAAYADGSLTLEQTVLAALGIGHCYNYLKKVSTDTYEVDLHKTNGLEVFEKQIEGLGQDYVNNHNISGPEQDAIQYTDNLKIKDVAAKDNQNNSGLHSKYSSKIRSVLLKHLKQLITKPKAISSKWITSSGNSSQFSYGPTKYASAEHFLNCLLNPVSFYEATSALPIDTVLLGIGFQAINITSGHNTIIMVSSEKNSINNFLSSLGQMYEMGYELKLDKLYPDVELPVSVGTSMLSPLIKWNHDANWFVALHKEKEKQAAKLRTGERLLTFSIKNTDLDFMTGHVVDGRNLIPATYYIEAVWETFSIIMGRPMTDTSVVFENVRFLRATKIPKTEEISFVVSIQKQTGLFKIAESGTAIATGRIYTTDVLSQETVNLPIPIDFHNGTGYSTEDVYKELKLRGYNYTGAFRGIKECNLSATKGLIEWTGNWVAFMDNMLQTIILQEDSRNLFVPTGIERLTISPTQHVDYAGKFEGNHSLPVYVYKELNMIRSGGIEMVGFHLNAISRKLKRNPLLESYKFVPFHTKLTINEAIRICVQIGLENNTSVRHRAVEIIDQATKPNSTPLSSVINDAFENQPLIKGDVVILTTQPTELANVIVGDSTLEGERNSCSLVTATNVLGRPEFAEMVETALTRNGFVISREDLNLNVEVAQENLQNLIVIAVQETETEKLVLLRKPVEYNPTLVLNLKDCHERFDWLNTFQNLTANDRLIVFAQGDSLHGIIGLYNCIKTEIGSLKVKCFFIFDKDTPTFNINDDFYAKQLQKGLSANVFKDGKWGTYRYLQLETHSSVKCEHSFNNVTVRGDLSSFRWFQGSLHSSATLSAREKLIYIYYSSLNFRDVIMASSHSAPGVFKRNRRKQAWMSGIEFAGRDSSGRRVMGIVSNGALASMVVADSPLVWEIPDEWTMEEAATVALAYSTVIYGLITIAQIKEGESVLIHSGTGAVAQAAIYVALHYKCVIFTTVGTQEKKEWIRQKFPQIPESHIGCSRDTSFEQMIMRETKGLGVDVVLNSLSQEKLLASIRCLAPNGRFLETGKHDMANNSVLDMKSFIDGRSFHGISLDEMLDSLKFREHLHDILNDGLKAGYVQPLNRTVFEENEVEEAFRFMASDKCTGKVLVKLRNEELDKKSLPDVRLFRGCPRFYCNPNCSYIICGGLGGFGLELADWLISRGADKLVLTSRRGLKTGYQASRMRIWKSYGVTVLISTTDITTREGCVKLIKEAHKLGPIEAIFNLAVIMKDVLLENQTEENYNAVLAPKAVATRHLDLLSRQLCPDLKHFVMFSTVICRIGNAGQTSYCLANSIMERICEQRKKDGYPALAVQWGVIGEVGLLGDKLEKEGASEFLGMMPQPISSCMEAMDTFLTQNETVVSSIVVAEKRGKSTDSNDMVQTVKNILGLFDLKRISFHTTFSELGMDSMMAHEIRQTLEREYEQFLTAKDIRSMTFARLLEISHEKKTESSEENRNGRTTTNRLQFLFASNNEQFDFTMTRLPSLIEENALAPKAFLLPGTDGVAYALESLVKGLKLHALCLPYPLIPQYSVEAVSELLLPLIHENLPATSPFTIIGYSYGCTVGLHLASLLEGEGRMGRLILIDGSPAMSKDATIQTIPNAQDERYLQTYLLCAWLEFYEQSTRVSQYQNELLKCETFDERINLAIGYLPKSVGLHAQYKKQILMTSYVRLQSMLKYKPSFPKLKSMVNLYKPTNQLIQNYDADYKLQELCEKRITVDIFDGDHVTILQNPKVSYAINDILSASNSV